MIIILKETIDIRIAENVHRENIDRESHILKVKKQLQICLYVREFERENYIQSKRADFSLPPSLQVFL